MKKSVFVLLLVFGLGSLYAQLPKKFDLRAFEGKNMVTSVKSQQGGTCWTHGTMAALEGNLLITGNWEHENEYGEPALAEYHLDWWNGFNGYFNADLEVPLNNNKGLAVHYGGDYRVSTAYMSRLEGAVREQDGQHYAFPPELFEEDYHIYYPKDVEWFTAGADLENIDLIKSKIIEHGVLATCLCSSGSFINGEYEHYQSPAYPQDPNHSVAIIGWDDDRETDAPDKGAWLVKNSWGSNWGNNGYFWISYYDKHATQHPEMGAVSFYNVERLQYDSVYYHDYHGWRDELPGTKEAFNAFICEKDENFVAGSFFTASHDVDYEYKIYDDFDGDSLLNLLYSQGGNIPYSGLHTVDFNQNVYIDSGDDFYVYLKLSKGGMPYDRTSTIPVLLGARNNDLVSSAANPGESFYNFDGRWFDFYGYDDPSGYDQTGNFCIKALTGGYSITDVDDARDEIKGGINKCYPNPFMQDIDVNYTVHKKADVQLYIVDLHGGVMDILIKESLSAGNYKVKWRAADISQGLYVVMLKMDGETISVKKIAKVSGTD